MESNRQHRDIQCADDVRLMAKMRRFDQEFTVYGTTEWRADAEVQYLATASLEKLYAYINRRKIEGSYFTPVVYYSKRTPMPSGMEKILPLAAKYTLLSQMKKSYETVDYFGSMKKIFEAAENDDSYAVLAQYRREIDGYFRERSLQTLSGLVRQAYEAKILSLDSLKQFLNWCDDAYRQIENMPMPGDKFKRTFYGFIYFEYQGDRRAQYFFDAEKTEVIRKWYQAVLKGFIACPILHKTVYFHQFNQLKDAREVFKEWLLEDQECIHTMLTAMKRLSGAVSADAFTAAEACCQGSADAENAVHYYKNMINHRK